MDLGLEGRVALVTGAAAGIGRSLMLEPAAYAPVLGFGGERP